MKGGWNDGELGSELLLLGESREAMDVRELCSAAEGLGFVGFDFATHDVERKTGAGALRGLFSGRGRDACKIVGGRKC